MIVKACDDCGRLNTEHKFVIVYVNKRGKDYDVDRDVHSGPLITTGVGVMSVNSPRSSRETALELCESCALNVATKAISEIE
jgi:hypothetical protein